MDQTLKVKTETWKFQGEIMEILKYTFISKYIYIYICIHMVHMYICIHYICIGCIYLYCTMYNLYTLYIYINIYIVYTHVLYTKCWNGEGLSVTKT